MHKATTPLNGVVFLAKLVGLWEESQRGVTVFFVAKLLRTIPAGPAWSSRMRPVWNQAEIVENQHSNR